MAINRVGGHTFTDDSRDLSAAVADAREMARTAPGEEVVLFWDRDERVYWTQWAEPTREYDDLLAEESNLTVVARFTES